MPQNAFFLRTRDLPVSKKTTQKHFFFPPSTPLSTVIFANATVLAFVLLCNSSFNLHCYTQREATPTKKSARKCALTSRDFLRENYKSAFTLANSPNITDRSHGADRCLCRVAGTGFWEIASQTKAASENLPQF